MNNTSNLNEPNNLFVQIPAISITWDDVILNHPNYIEFKLPTENLKEVKNMNIFNDTMEVLFIHLSKAELEIYISLLVDKIRKDYEEENRLPF